MDQKPPQLNTYKPFFKHQSSDHNRTATINESSLPVIDLHPLKCNDKRLRKHCKQNIVKAAKEWGFFLVINHNMPYSLLKKMRTSMLDIFQLPLEQKQAEFLECGSNCYRSGMPNGSEAYHIPLSLSIAHKNLNIRHTIEEYARFMLNLAHELCTILEEGLGYNGNCNVKESCKYDTCYLRLNHYPSCHAIDGEDFAMIPHTDTDFLTVVFQDEVGGLELKKGDKWVPVKPNPDALIINIGDLFQALSNGAYKSVEHRVLSNLKKERFSIAFFLCPSSDTVIRSQEELSVYREFTFKEFKEQIKEDVKLIGNKVGLSRFLKT